MAPVEHRPGRHLLIDLWGARHLTDAPRLEAVLRAAAAKAGATVIAARFHGFPGHAGVTGMVLLAESHISIHTWPETGFAAIDIFMCGPADPRLAQRQIEADLRPDRVAASEIRRGETRGRQAPITARSET